MKLNCKMRTIGVCIWTWYSLCLATGLGYEDTIFGALDTGKRVKALKGKKKQLFKASHSIR
jgi:hypothetical protein